MTDKRRFAVFDIDGTVYREAMSFLIAEKLLERPEFADEAAKMQAARHTYKSRGSTEAYWTYNKTMLELCEALLPRVSPTELTAIIKDLLAAKARYCYAYPLRLMRELRAEQYFLMAISGSIGNIVEPFARGLGFDEVVASELEVIDGAFTGKRVTQTKQGKAAILQQLVEKHNLTFEGSLAVGDTHRDISMLALTERAVAFNPNAALYDEAAKRGWDIVLERKNVVYELSSKHGMYQLEQAGPSHDDNHQEHLQ